MKENLQDLFSRELDILQNAIVDENRTLAVCSREEIWKILSNIVESEKKKSYQEGRISRQGEIDFLRHEAYGEDLTPPLPKSD